MANLGEGDDSESALFWQPQSDGETNAQSNETKDHGVSGTEKKY